MKNFLSALEGAAWALGLFLAVIGLMTSVGYLADHITLACSK